MGYERLASAPFAIDIAQPMRQHAFRVDAVYDWGFPSRAEALFASPNKWPRIPERSVSYQDICYVAEIGVPATSVRTVIPLRILDPVRNPNTGGLGDIQVDTRLVLLNGEIWQITQFMGMRIQSGAFQKGLGTGHFSLEPGLLARYEWRCETLLHGELRFLIPLGGDPLYQGHVLRWGLGASHLLYDGDCCSIIPTLETVFHSVLDGAALGPYGELLPVDGEMASTLHYGVRVSFDTGRDFGLIEFGLGGGFNLLSNGWYERMLRFEFRIVY